MSRCCGLITAPIFAVGSRSVAPTLIAFTASASGGSSLSAALPIVTAVEPAMQRWPAHPNAASTNPVTELSKSASGITKT